MSIRLMKVFEYDGTGRNCAQSDALDPPWEQIEKVIRRLDKFRFPFVWFFQSERLTENAIPDFEVMGGDGEYSIAGTSRGGKRQWFFDPSHGNDQIDLWLSDQGTSLEANRVCYDVNQVLVAVRCFNESGEFAPEIGWKVDD